MLKLIIRNTILIEAPVIIGNKFIILPVRKGVIIDAKNTRERLARNSDKRSSYFFSATKIR
jgi:hypothetical protein